MKKVVLSTIASFLLSSLSYAITDLQACFNQFNAGNYKLAVFYGQKAVKEYPASPTAYYCLGKAYSRTGQITKAIESLKKASSYTSNDRYLMYIYNWLGSEYESQGDDSNALFYDSKSLKLAEQLGNNNVEYSDLNNIADVFHDKGYDAKALLYYKKALELVHGKVTTGAIYNNIAMIYEDTHHYKKAIKYFQTAINIDDRYGRYLSGAEDMLNLGDAYRRIKDFKDAKFYFDSGLERMKKVGNKDGEGLGYGYLGLYYRDIGNKILARKYFTKALNIFRSIGDYVDVSATLKYLSSFK